EQRSHRHRAAAAVVASLNPSMRYRDESAGVTRAIFRAARSGTGIMCGHMPQVIGRRGFFAAMGAAAVGAAGCRSRGGRGPIVLRLSHSMSAGATALHVLADSFRT